VDDVAAVSDTIEQRPARAARRSVAPGAPHTPRAPIVADVAEQAVRPAARPAPAAPKTTRRRPATAPTRAAVMARQRALEAAAATIRRALLDAPLDEALPQATVALAAALAPARVRVLLAEEALAIGEPGRPGGQELFPLLRPRATAEAGAIGATPELDALAESVVMARKPLLAPHGAPGDALEMAAFPLRAHGQFQGALALATALPLAAGQTAALEALADLYAAAVEHDRMLHYSQGQEALAQTVLRHAPVAVAVLRGPRAVFAIANPAFAQLVGVEGTLRGRRLADLGELAERLRDGFRLDAVYRTGEPQAMVELPIQLERGLTYWNVTTSPLPGRGARVGGVLVAAVDVTHQVVLRRRAQDAAQLAQERISQMTALHTTSLAVARQLDADPRALLADILRRSIALLRARAGAVYVADQRTRELEVVVCQGLRGDYTGRRVREGQGIAGQVARTHQGVLADDIRLYPTSPVLYEGEAVSAAVTVPLIHRGTVVGVLDVLDDADRRTFAPDDLWLLELFAAQAAQAIENAHIFVELERAYQAQRELDHLKDDFIATASHELRTPLTGVQGFLDLLVTYPGSRDEPQAVELLQSAAESATELTALTEQLLQTSQLESGRLEVRAAPVSLARLARAAVRAQAERLAASGARHTLECDIAPEVTVLADGVRLRQVLDNLLSNAIKYSPAGGLVRIACQVTGGGAPSREPPRRPSQGPLPLAGSPAVPAPWQPGHAAATPYVTITVADAGIGIGAHEREQLFGRFARLEGARSGQMRGAGLGLYICRQLMEAMGGAIWLEDGAPGRGSVFALRLPLAPA
jgi:signal transduction histidine kinase/PAS domain-containing protein